MARERDVRLDVLKALAIVLVIFGHSITAVYARATHAPIWLASVFTVVAATNVPLFMFVAGYLARPSADAKWVGSRALRLLVPFVAWSAIVWFWAFRTTPFFQWMGGLMLWPYDSGLWFLYVLFMLCVAYAVFGWNRWLLIAVTLASFLIDTRVRIMGAGLVVSQLPIFVAGFLLSRREKKFDPEPWVIGVAAVLLLLLWTEPGFNPMYAVPQWSINLSGSLGTGAWVIDPVMVLVRVLRAALELSLVASCFWLVREVRHGHWLGAITLGMYASHQFFFPSRLLGSADLLDVVSVFAVTTIGAAGTAILLERWQTSQFLLLGWGKLPSWVTSRRPKKAVDPG